MILVGVAGCGVDYAAGSGGDGSGGMTSDPSCASGMRWTGVDHESPLMHPGGDCIGCHSSGEGPRFAIAGTVSESLSDPVDCYGVQGAVVTITDAASQTFTLTTNEAGNFYLSARTAVTMPIHASIAFEGRTRAMVASQVVGACASCHTSAGANGAPGRILAP
jgi:hypothetical protein